MTTLDNEYLAKNGNNYYCECCDYSTCKKYNYVIHFDTKKHKNNVITTGNNDFLAKNSTQKKYSCKKCDKIFNDRAGLWRHNKKCDPQQNTVSDITGINNSKSEESLCEKIEIYDLVKYLMKENNELKSIMMEQNNKMIEQQNIVLEIAKNGTHNTTHTNSHNKAFNLNFFLNETCKDAMNIMDFVESIQLQLSDLENVGEIGYVEGISNIIVKNLNALDVTQRPVHCTDKKRETIYIKDEDKWEKDEEKNKIRKVIKKVATKNARLIQKFKEKHPDYNLYHSKYSTQYNKLIIESLGGSGDNDLEKEDKIIRNITKNIVVEK
jgi:hypothetical protein